MGCGKCAICPRGAWRPAVAWRGLSLLALLAAGLCLSLPASGDKPAATGCKQPVRLGLSVHVARLDGKPVVDRAFIKRQIETANRIFAPYGVAFAQEERHARRPRHARMETRADRHALGAHVRPRFINLFMVASLRDVDDPSRMRRGVHWRSRTHAPAHFVIVSAAAFDAVLAHELGHFLGNHRHSQTPGNLMSYQHTEVLPFLDRPQQRRLQRTLRRYLRTGELVDLARTAEARASQRESG